MTDGRLVQRLSKASLCLAIILFVIVQCTPRPSPETTTPESLPIICAPTTPAESLIVSNRQMSLTVADIELAIDQVRDILADFGGYVDQEQPQTYRSTEANFTVRLPKKSINQASEQIKLMAEVITDERAIGQDITEQYAHLEAQLCELQDEALALRQRITPDPADHLNAQLADLENEIEFIRGKIDYRDERLALATLTLYLVVE